SDYPAMLRRWPYWTLSFNSWYLSGAFAMEHLSLEAPLGGNENAATRGSPIKAIHLN
ncbi:hypothetical protein Csa_023838, partial [Cucumis sativus]